jgi:hypothetical protein
VVLVGYVLHKMYGHPLLIDIILMCGSAGLAAVAVGLAIARRRRSAG